MIVVDNSVLVPAIIENEWSARARIAASNDRQWIVPPLWQFEFTNVMVNFIRSGRLTNAEVRTAIDEARMLVANRVVAVDQQQAVRIAASLNLSGYDAQYAALADEYGVRCVTNDKQFAERAATLALHLEDMAK